MPISLAEIAPRLQRAFARRAATQSQFAVTGDSFDTLLRLNNDDLAHHCRIELSPWMGEASRQRMIDARVLHAYSTEPWLLGSRHKVTSSSLYKGQSAALERAVSDVRGVSRTVLQCAHAVRRRRLCVIKCRKPKFCHRARSSPLVHLKDML